MTHVPGPRSPPPDRPRRGRDGGHVRPGGGEAWAIRSRRSASRSRRSRRWSAASCSTVPAGRGRSSSPRSAPRCSTPPATCSPASRPPATGSTASAPARSARSRSAPSRARRPRVLPLVIGRLREQVPERRGARVRDRPRLRAVRGARQRRPRRVVPGRRHRAGVRVAASSWRIRSCCSPRRVVSPPGP